MPLLYDPPSGWMYGFPRPYLPLDGETVEQTLIRDGYPQHEAVFGARHCRFIGDLEELPGYKAKKAAEAAQDA